MTTALGVLVFRSLASKPSPPTPPPVLTQHDEEQRRQEVRDAFGNQKPPDQDAAAQELKQFFDELGGAYRARDADAIMAHYDPERMVDEVARLGVVTLRNDDKAALLRGMRQGMTKSLREQARFMQWTSSEIKNVKKLGDDEAVVVVRHQDAQGTSLKLRWWVIRRADGWKIYDMEALDVSMRLSTTMASLVAGRNPGDLPELSRATKTLGEAAGAARLNDPDAAEEKLKQIEQVKLPQSLEDFRLVVIGMVQLQRGRPDEALDSLQKAEKLSADMPILDLLEGTAFNRLGRRDEALKRLEAYRDLFGEDAVVCLQLGEALRGLRRFPEAAQTYRKSLDFNSKNTDAFWGLLRSIGGKEKKDDLGTRFAKLDHPSALFVAFAEDCERRKLPELLEPLARAMHQIDPDFGPGAYYLALCEARAGRSDQATPLFRTALAGQADAGVRDEYVTGFLQAMASAGKFLDAYEAAPDPVAAFRLLAGEAQKTYRPDELRRLVTVHGKKRPDDPLLLWYQADVYVKDGRYPLAEKTFAAALAKPPDEETLESFRASRVLARYHTGQAMSAYRDIKPRRDTFLQLASLLLQDRKDAELEALLDARAGDDPDGVDVPSYRCRMKIRRNQTAEGVELFKAVLARPMPEEKREEIASDLLVEFVSAGKAVDGYLAAPDANKAFRLEADEILEDGDIDDLPPLIEAHRRRQPADPWLAYYQGEVDSQNQAWDKAVRGLKDGMRTAPKDVRDDMRWKLVFAMYKASGWRQAYVESEDPDKAFAQLAAILAGDKKGAELEELVRLHGPKAGDKPELLFYDAQARALLKQPADAASLLQKACEKQPDENARGGYVRSVLLDMLDAGLVLEGYRAAPDKSLALDVLAGQLVFRKKDKELAGLLEEHGKAHADEPLLQYYTGELLLLHGDPRQAERCFAAALAKAPPVEQWRCRAGLFRAGVKAGRAAALYQEHEPGANTFVTLAELCLEEKDAAQLQALIDAHREVDPDDPNLAAWGLEVLWLNQDYEGALKLLSEHREDVFAMPAHRWKADDCRVRCLVKLKRNDEAVREAEELVKGGGNRVLLVLARAAAGDVKQAVAALEEAGPKPYFAKSCYQDTDLGPILRTEPFREFREKFPEPKDKEDPAGSNPDG